MKYNPICPKCGLTMVCAKNGVKVVWNGFHARSGDRYECPGKDCDNAVITGFSDAYNMQGHCRVPSNEIPMRD